MLLQVIILGLSLGVQVGLLVCLIMDLRYKNVIINKNVSRETMEGKNVY